MSPLEVLTARNCPWASLLSLPWRFHFMLSAFDSHIYQPLNQSILLASICYWAHLQANATKCWPIIVSVIERLVIVLWNLLVTVRPSVRRLPHLPKCTGGSPISPWNPISGDWRHTREQVHNLWLRSLVLPHASHSSPLPHSIVSQTKHWQRFLC